MVKKNICKICVIFICVILFGYNSFSQQNCVVDIYTAEIGIREATGNNDGKQVEEYLASCHLGKGNAWCAAFVNWTLQKCGYETVKSPAWSPSWFTPDYLIYKRNSDLKTTPDQADVFGIYFANKGRIAHVGFIDSWPENDNFCITVEGNTNEAGSREGDGVYKKRRLKSQINSVSRFIK